jgi:hypothetical protein
VGTIGTTFLGLTVACARCHDHKYDPIPSRDYYNLAANFTKAVRANVNVPRDPAEGLVKEAANSRAGWTALEAKEDKVRGGRGSDHQLTRQADGSYLLTRVNGEVNAVEFVAQTPLTGLTAVRIEALTDQSLPNYGPGLGDDGNFTLSGFALTAGPIDGKEKPQPVKLTMTRSATGAKGGAWSVGRQDAGRDQAAIYTLEKPIEFPAGAALRFKLSFPGDSPAARQSIGKFRISVCAGEVPKEIDSPQHVVPPHEVAFVVTENVPPYRMMIQGPDLFEKTYVLKRGDVDKKDGEATPGVLEVLSQSGQTRSDHPRSNLAIWLTDVDHGAGGLVARVIVNRLWQHHMGRGIVGTASDFGAQGDRPTHPELLDWLASELIEKGWSLKSIHREILLSAAYQRSSTVNPKSAAVDPDNRLYWRHSLVRLEAEPIRDAMLAVSGRLDRRQFGPGSLDEDMTRRSIYFTVKRSALIPSMAQLDWPEALQGVGQRVTTTVAPQALLMLNSPQVRANAAAFAALLKPAAERSLAVAVMGGYERAFGRLPTAVERTVAMAFLTEQIKADGLDLALTNFCQALFAGNEFFYVK